MFCLQNIIFCKREPDLSLYVEKKSIKNILLVQNRNCVRFKNELSLNTYFNSFYTNFWLNHTKISSLVYKLHIEGDLRIRIFFARVDQVDELVYEKKYKGHSRAKEVKIPIQMESKHRNGRFYIVFESTEKRATLKQGGIYTQKIQKKQVFLSIVICTYHREKSIKNLLNALKELYKQTPQFMLCLIDNGKSFKNRIQYPFDFTYIPNKNLGGAGGFTRGIYESCRQDKPTHLLLMDDDIEFDPEIIFRMIACFGFSQKEIMISGNMLDNQRRLDLFEAGCLYSFKKIDVIPNLRYQQMDSLRSLNQLSTIQHADYAAWFCCGLSVDAVEKVDLPLPIFIRGDDIEYGIRLSRNNIPTVVTPGIAVWHESFYTRGSSWAKYYMIRNLFIINYLHSKRTYPLRQFVKLSQCFIGYLCLFEHSAAVMVLKGLEDFLKGPDLFKKTDFEKYHAHILKICQPLELSDAPELTKNLVDGSKYNARINPFKIAWAILTLNGNLLPQFLLKNKIIQYQRDQLSFQKPYLTIQNTFGYKYIQKYNPVYSSYENRKCIPKKKLIPMLLRFFRLNFVLLFKSNRIRKSWQKQAPFFTSRKYWENVF